MLILGDCLEKLGELPENSVDALVTDPPAGISFMGKDWDDDKGGRDHWIEWLSQVMQECLRLLKPGAHGLVWAIPRTSHWTGMALERAGFEVRDVVTHLFGQGFPKSQNISIAIDKQAGAIGHRGRAFTAAGAGDRKDIQATSGWATDPGYKAITDAAKEWSGWGTALKPACEMWFLVRKPISEKTVAANVLKWGCGGLNIDGCRIEAKDQHVLDAAVKRMTGNKVTEGNFSVSGCKEVKPNSAIGRFPSNLLFSHSPNCTEDACDMFECAVKMLDEQSGQSKSSAKVRYNKASPNLAMRGGNKGHISGGHEDSVGASRFFYCAKVSPSERGKDNKHPTVKPLKLMRYLCRLITPPQGTILDPFLGSGSTGVAALQEGFQFIGIEREQEYFQIAQSRVQNEERAQ